MQQNRLRVDGAKGPLWIDCTSGSSVHRALVWGVGCIAGSKCGLTAQWVPWAISSDGTCCGFTTQW
eukprot:7680632-Lingulodinium_polyedra.AAC.1